MSLSLHTHFRQTGFMRLPHRLTRVMFGQPWKPLLFHANSVLLYMMLAISRTSVSPFVGFLSCSHLIGGPSEHTAAFLRYLSRPLDLRIFPDRAGVTKTAPSHQRNPPPNNLIRKFRKSGRSLLRDLCTRQKQLTKSSLHLTIQPVDADQPRTPPLAYSMASLTNSLTLERDEYSVCRRQRLWHIRSIFPFQLYKHVLQVCHYGIFKHYWRDLGRVTKALPPYISIHVLHKKAIDSLKVHRLGGSIRGSLKRHSVFAQHRQSQSAATGCQFHTVKRSRFLTGL